jgi:hypothetical protein
MKTFPSMPLVFQTDREMLKPICSPAEDCSLVDGIKAFFRSFPTCSAARSQSTKTRLDPSLANLSSITTPNGPWVYTIVPWED